MSARGFPEVEIHFGKFHFSGLDLGQVEDVVDDIEQVSGRASQGFHAVLLLGVQAGSQDDFAHAQDGVHGRAYFVAHAGQEIAFGLGAHPGGLQGPAQLLLGPFQFGDVPSDAGYGRDLVIPVILKMDVPEHVVHVARAAHHTVLVRGVLDPVLDPAGKRPEGPLPVLGVDEIEDGQADAFLRRQPQDFFADAVEEGVAALGVHPGDEIVGAFHHLPVAFLALPERLLVAPLLGDVPGVDGQPVDLAIEVPDRMVDALPGDPLPFVHISPPCARAHGLHVDFPPGLDYVRREIGVDVLAFYFLLGRVDPLGRSLVYGQDIFLQINEHNPVRGGVQQLLQCLGPCPEFLFGPFSLGGHQKIGRQAVLFRVDPDVIPVRIGPGVEMGLEGQIFPVLQDRGERLLGEGGPGFGEGVEERASQDVFGLAPQDAFRRVVEREHGHVPVQGDVSLDHAVQDVFGLPGSLLKGRQGLLEVVLQGFVFNDPLPGGLEFGDEFSLGFGVILGHGDCWVKMTVVT